MTVDPEFEEWVRAWAADYPADHDDVLEPLRDKPQFDRDDVVVVVAWKFISMAHRKANALASLAREPEARIQDITQRAFACNDDLGALLVVDHLHGVGPA